MRYFQKFSIFQIALVAMVALTSSLAGAQDAPNSTPDSTPSVLISIGPVGKEDGSRFEIEVAPGETKETMAVMQNHGTEPIELRTYPSGIVPMANGGLKMADRETEPTGSALWMSFESGEFTLAPGESIERPIVVSVPADAKPGQYVNAVALETVNPVNEGSSTAFDQYFRKVVSVYITVPGEIVPDFTLGEPEVLVVQGRSGLRIPITNSGNIRIDIRGSVSLTDGNGNVIHQGEVATGPIYMGQETEIQVPFATVPAPGDYTITYELFDNNSDVAHSLDQQAIVVPEDSAPRDGAMVTFENVLVEANADPIVFANVSVDINMAVANRSTRLTLSVYHDGELVEDFVLAENLSLAQGVTTVTQRYLPATNWKSGEYTFSLKLESTEDGETSLLYEKEDVATLEVP